MGASKKLKLAIMDKDMTLKQFAEKAGKPYQSFLNMLHRDSMSFSSVEELADIIDCDVVLRDRKSGKIY